MQLGCHSYTFRTHDRETVFATLPLLGLTAVELWAGHAPYLAGGPSPRDVGREAAVRGLTISAYSIGGLFGLTTRTVGERVARAFDFAHALGTDLVTGIVDRAAVPAIDARATAMRMRFACENHWYTELARPADCAAALADTSPAVGAAIDTGHFAYLGLDLAEVARTLAPRTLDVHLKVVRPAAAVTRAVRRWRRRFALPAALPGPGDGLDSFVSTLAAAGYRGVLAIEHEASRMRGTAEADVLLYRERVAALLTPVAAREERRRA